MAMLRGAALALFAEVRSAGVGRVFGSVDARVSVVSLSGRITVWVRGGAFCWRGADGAQRTHQWADAQGAARSADGRAGRPAADTHGGLMSRVPAAVRNSFGGPRRDGAVNSQGRSRVPRRPRS